MPGRLLPLNQKEIEEVHKFVQEHLMLRTLFTFFTKHKHAGTW